MSLVERIMQNTAVYRLWQAPFAESKLAPIKAHNDLSRVRRVLDVGCGPGTNTRHFLDKDYLGVDINERYVSYARRRYRREFVAADITRWHAQDGGFDFILVNSFLHHLDAADCQAILTHLETLLTPDGHVHILELVLPEEASAARRLARWDRGAFARPEAEWRRMFTEHFTADVFEPYCLGLWGLELWKMVYFKGGPIQP